MQATPDDGLWEVWKCSRQFLLIYQSIPTWNQDTYHETWKDLNKVIQTKCVFII